MIRLIDIYDSRGEPRFGVIGFLYDLLAERNHESNISHKAMPSMAEHVQFVKRHPYRLWYLIQAQTQIPALAEHWPWVGYVYATQLNEIGIMIKKIYRGQGIAPLAINELMRRHQPATGLPSQRNGNWVANIGPHNAHSRHMFTKLGFRLISETYELPGTAIKGGDAYGRQDATTQLRQEQPASGSARPTGQGGSQAGDRTHSVEGKTPPA